MPVMSLENYILNVFLGLHSKRTTALLSKKIFKQQSERGDFS